MTRFCPGLLIVLCGLTASTRAQPQPNDTQPKPAESPATEAPAPAAPQGEPKPAAAGLPVTSPKAAPTDRVVTPAAATTPNIKPQPPAAKEPVKVNEKMVQEFAHSDCATPAKAWSRFLWWLQKGDRWDEQQASKCFDSSKLNKRKDIKRLAGILKQVIDAENAYVTPADFPTDPNYVDKSGYNRYWDPAVKDEVSRKIYVEKVGDQWLFSAETVAAIPTLETFMMKFRRWLPSWMTKTVLGVELWSYLGIFVLFFLALAIQRFVVFLVGTYARARIGGRHKRTRKAIQLASRPVGGLVMASVFHIGFPQLLFPIHVSRIANFATEILFLFSIVWLAYRMIDVFVDFLRARADRTEGKMDDQLVPMVATTLKVAVSIIGGIFILQNLDVDVGSLLAGLGLGGLAFALAAKDTIANFFGSLMIFIDKPFQIGDWIVLDGTEGVIEDVGFRTSRVRTFYNSQITVPNALVTNKMIDNYGRRQYRRYVTNLGLCYDTPPDKVQAFCEGVRAVIHSMDGMRKDYYLVEFKEFGDSALVIMVYCFMESKTWNDELRTRTELNLAIMRLAGDLGVSFAYPTQTLHIETQAKAGESRPTHSGPSSPAELVSVVDRYATRSQPKKAQLTAGYYSDGSRTEAGDGGGEG